MVESNVEVKMNLLFGVNLTLDLSMTRDCHQLGGNEVGGEGEVGTNTGALSSLTKVFRH